MPTPCPPCTTGNWDLLVLKNSLKIDMKSKQHKKTIVILQNLKIQTSLRTKMLTIYKKIIFTQREHRNNCQIWRCNFYFHKNKLLKFFQPTSMNGGLCLWFLVWSRNDLRPLHRALDEGQFRFWKNVPNWAKRAI